MGMGQAGSPRQGRPKPMDASLEPPSQPFMVHEKMVGLGPGSTVSVPAKDNDDASSAGHAYAAMRFFSDAAATHGTAMESIHDMKMDIHMQEKMKSDMPRPGMRFHIHGSIKPPPPKDILEKRMPPKSDTKLQYGRLSIFCYDRMTGHPIPGCAVCVTTLDRFNNNGQLNAGSTFGRATISTENGMVIAKVLAGRAYVLSATCTGYYPFGKLGERLLVNVQDGKTSKLKMAMVPIKVGVIITAKELMPDKEAAQHRFNVMAKLGDEAGQHGITQEVAALMFEEKVTLEDKLGSKHAKFNAFSLPQKSLLEVRRMQTGELVGCFSTDNDGRSFFYGPMDPVPSSPKKVSAAMSRALSSNGQELSTTGQEQTQELLTIEEGPGGSEGAGALVKAPPQPENSGAEAVEKTSLTHLEVGWYTVSLNDPTRMVVFSGTRNKDEELEVDVGENYEQEIPFEVKDPGPTYSAQPNRYNVPQSAKAIEDIYTDNTSQRYIGMGPGRGMYLPVELYCRLRPKMQILIFDTDTDIDIGTREAVYFQIQKVVKTFREIGDEDFMSESKGTRAWKKTAMQTLVPKKNKKRRKKKEQDGKSGWVDVSMVDVFSGHLNNTSLMGCQSLDEMYGLPGERYSVVVQGQDPYVEWTQRQSSMMTWDAHEFPFYFQKKVTLVVGLRERYSHAPCVGRTVRIEVVEVPPPPVPPPPLMRKQEGTAHYAHRILEHILDWVVESHEEETIDNIARDFELDTDDDGLIRVSVPPLSLVRVLTTADGDYEDEEMVEDVEVSEQPEQFVGFNMERKCFLQVTMYDAATKELLEGVKIQILILEDQNQDVLDPPKLVLEDLTDSNGGMEKLNLRAGTRAMVKVLEAPFYHLAPRYMPSGSDQLTFRITGGHHCEMYLPRKPRVKIAIHDCTSGEEVMGVKFRVLVDRTLSRSNQDISQQHGTPQEAKSEFDLSQMDSWGEEMYRCYTGSPDVHRLFVDAQCKVGLQIIPMWPYRIAPQMHIQYSGGVKGCAPFVFWIVRDPAAAAFWKKRDEVIHDLWDTEGVPCGPPWHHMARLQPIISSGRAIMNIRQEMVYLRPGWHPATRYKPDITTVNFEGIHASQSPGAFLGGDGADGGEDSAAAAAKFLLEGSYDPQEEMRKKALDHMRMGDPKRLPIEQRKLMNLLQLWGCFKHVKGTNCQCQLPKNRMSPFTMQKPDPKERKRFVGNSELEKEPASGQLRIGSQTVDPGHYVAGEVLKAIAETFRNKAGIRRITSGGKDEEDREAIYCDSPFFTLWMPDGQGIHVGVHDGLYRDLVLCMEKLRSSMRACDEQLDKIEAYNATRSIDGAFAFGQECVDARTGGLFLIDTSAAMPPNALSFVSRQLGCLLEHWYANMDDEEGAPMFNVVAATGNSAVKFSDRLKPVNGNMMNILPPWLMQGEDTTQVGFNMVKALKMALRLADGKVPIYIITGSMSVGFNGYTASEVFQLVESDFKGHIAANESVQPVHNVEVHPVPLTLLLNPKSSQWEAAQEAARSKAPSMAGGRAPPAPGSIGNTMSTGNIYIGAATTTTGVDDPYEGTKDIFMRLAMFLTDKKIRLMELFREEDKNNDMKLNTQELGGLLRRCLPTISPAQLRYMQVMLDVKGKDAITYKDLSETIKLCKKAGVTVKANEGLELVDVLRKLAMKQIKEALNAKELFAVYDTNRSGFLGKTEVYRLLRDLMPCINSNELDDLSEALWTIDHNGDSRISREEFAKALRVGGAESLDLGSMGNDAGCGGFDKAELAAAASASGIKLGNDNKNKKGVTLPADDEPSMVETGDGAEVRDLMFKLCAVTAGKERTFDMGSAKAAAEYVDLGPIRATRQRLEEEYEKMAVFEKQYGGRVLIEKRNREGWKERRAAALSGMGDGSSGPKPLRRRPASASSRPKSASASANLAARRSARLHPATMPVQREEIPAPASRTQPPRRPQTAPSRRSPPQQRIARPGPDSRWQVDNDGIAVLTGTGAGSSLASRIAGSARQVASTSQSLEISSMSGSIRPEASQGSIRPEASQRDQSPGRLKQNQKSFPAGFRDPRDKKPEPEESIYGI